MKLKSLTLILAVALGAQVAFAQQSKSDPSVEFNPHWYGQIQGGAAYTIGETAFKNLISPAGALSLGYQFNPTLGVRFNAAGFQGKGAVVSPLEVYKFNYLQGAFDLTLNLAQLFGYKHDRVFNPFVFIGGGAAFGFNNGANKVTKTNPKEYFALLWEKNMITPVARVGLGADFRLSDAVALTLEVNDNVLSDKFNSKKVGHPDFQFNALAGLKINFGKTTRPSAKYLAELAAAEAAAAAEKARLEAERAAKLAAEKAAAEKAAAEKAAADKLAAEKAAAEKLAAEMRQVNTFFTINSYVISDEEAAKLIRYIDWLKANPDVNIAIAGHADKGTGTKRINQKLSEQRAAAVKAFLTERGIAESRIVSVVANGDRIQPFEENDLNRVVISTIE
ncbi:MAG: OmpA family protein [Bacteroidales bacterium]|jgi:outer membrane protein OmpA-like peptidoglycan-associated protein|nr:OmpA family protein [Bacteroidales bacterium]